MQPTYLPWSGYFNLMASVDVFYYLDDAQFEKGTWQQRNKVLVNGQSLFLTVPTIRKYLGQPINDIKIKNENSSWRKKHLSTLELAYKKRPYFETLEEILSIISNESYTYLLDLNLAIIECVCNMLSINSRRILSSSKNLSSTRSQKILDLCAAEQCNLYISPLGASEYLEEDHFQDNGSIDLKFQDYACLSYQQGLPTDFISHLSILDVLVNIGVDSAKKYIRQSPVDG